MSLLFADGFDYYSTISQIWDDSDWMNSNTTTNARNGAGRCAAGGNGALSFIKKNTANVAAFVMGFGYYSPSGYSGTYVIWQGLDGTSNQIEIRSNGSQFYVARNGTQIGSTFAFPSSASWHYWEVKGTIASGTSGSVEVKIDGIVVFTVTGVNTSNTGNAWLNVFSLRGTSAGNPNFDDIYILSQSGAVNNNYLGDQAVRAYMATAAGTHTDFTPTGAGTNFGCTNEIPADDDTTYVASSTPGQIDSYAMADLPGGVSSVAAVIAMIRHRKDDAGTRVDHIYVKSGATVSESPDIGVPTSYQYNSYIMETDPNTSAAWGTAAVNAVEVGAKEIS